MDTMTSAAQQTLYRPVPGYTDLYAGLDSTIVLAGVGELKPTTRKNGYVYVYPPGIKGGIGVHRLMSAAYLGEIGSRKVHVRHTDHDKSHNTIDNLCVGSPKQNTQDSILNGTHGAVTNAAKEKCSQGHWFTPENTYVIPNSPGWRQCRTCRKDIQDRKLRAKRAGKPSIAEKRLLVDAALKLDSTRSGRSLAKELNVSATMVERRRKMMED